MLELFNEAFSAANIVITLLLIGTLIYWIFVILGAIDLEFLNFDIDADIDIDIDMDMDMDMDIDADVDADIDADAGGGGSSFFISALQFFNVGKIPFMLFFSTLTLCIWVISILINYYIGNDSFGGGLALLVPNLIVSLFINKILTTPLASLFTKIDKAHTEVDIVGHIGTLLFPTDNINMGQAEVEVNNSDHRLVNVKALKNQQFKKGDQVVIIEKSKEKDFYFIERLD